MLFFRQRDCTTGLLCLLLLTLSLGLGACKNASAPETDVFRMNLATEPPELDPAKADDLTSYTVIMALMKGLTQWDAQMQLKPAIATSWEQSPDGLRYTFHLRPSARWSDGRPVTSQDFRFAWLRALKAETAAPYSYFLFDIHNAKRFADGKLHDVQQLGIQTPDAHTLCVQLERPSPLFLAFTAAPVLFPLRADLLQQDGNRFTEAGHFLSDGAYQLQSWRHEERIRLTPNPYFYEHAASKRPGVRAVEMLMVNDPNTSVVMYENHELDFIETTASLPAAEVRRLQHHPDAHTLAMHRINYYGFNTQKPPFNHAKVRQAFALALNRDDIFKLLQNGERPIASWISPGLLGYNPSIGLNFNPPRARQLLAEAGYPNGKGFPPVTLAFRSQSDIQKEAEIVQYEWQKHLGVRVRLEKMEWKSFLSQLDQDPPQIFKLGWFVDYPDPDSYLSVFQTGNGNNHTRWTQPAYDALLRRALLAPNAAQRQALYQEAQHLLLEEEAVIIPTGLAQKLYLLSPRFSGLSINALNLMNLDTLRPR